MGTVFWIHGQIKPCWLSALCRFHCIDAFRSSRSYSSLKEEFVPHLPYYGVFTRTSDICREECNHLVSASFLEGTVTFFCGEAFTQLRLRTLPRVTLCDKVRVGLAFTVCAHSRFGSLVHSACYRGSPWMPDSSQRIQRWIIICSQ